MTEQEFLAWMSESDSRAEWVDGEVIELMPPSKRHQSLLLTLGFLHEYFVAKGRLGVVLGTPFAVKLRGGGSYREPDLLFVAEIHSDRLYEDRLDGPADLLVEIVSDDSVTRDHREKRIEYQSVGVPEY